MSSKALEYLSAACGYDSQGLPAAMTQFTFGLMPFSVADNEKIEDLTKITVVCQTEAAFEAKIKDNLLEATWDFSSDSSTFAELFGEIEFHQQQLSHVEDVLGGYMAELDIAQQNNDENAIDDVTSKIRATDIPFLLPTVVPTIYDGDVHIGFENDPKFIYFTGDKLNQYPYKLVMVFDLEDMFVEDEVEISTIDADSDYEAMQEDAYWQEEAKRLEEDAYMAQFGQGNSLYDDDDNYGGDTRLNGVRIK